VRDAIRRGDDTVPDHQAASSRPGMAVAEGPGAGTGHRERAQHGYHSLGWSMQRLQKDPSLRYSEFGQSLLRRLELLVRGPDAVRCMIDALPSHCGYLIAGMARECARQWLELAETLEHRLRNTG